MKKIATVLIIAGLIIGAYPFIDRAYTVYEQSRILSDFDKTLSEKPDAETSKDYIGIDNALKSEPEASSTTQVTTSSQSNKKSDTSNQKVLGVLKIDKINLILPILDGATLQNMKIGAGRIKGTGNIGEIGNVALAAHRSYTYGRFFNRLDELQVGDKVYIITQSATYEYTIYQKLFVKPNDVSVLNRNNKDKILTLITCHPLFNPTGRLVFHAIQK